MSWRITETQGVAVVHMNSNNVNRQNDRFFAELSDALDQLEEKYPRHPVVLTREAATVDLFTDGRLELGLGAGHMKFEYDGACLSYDPPGTRVTRLGEAAADDREQFEA